MIVDVLVHVLAVCCQLKGWGICVSQKAKWPLTLDVPIETNSSFLLTISIHCQEIRLWEYINFPMEYKNYIQQEEIFWLPE